MARAERKQPNFQFDVLLYRDDGQWAAHCLQLDLVEYGTWKAAQGAIRDVSRAHIEYALEHDNMDYLFHPAPSDIWKLFLKSKLIGRKTIRIHTPPDVPALPSVTVQESSVPDNAAA
jgi:hypothetical protein